MIAVALGDSPLDYSLADGADVSDTDDFNSMSPESDLSEPTQEGDSHDSTT